MATTKHRESGEYIDAARECRDLIDTLTKGGHSIKSGDLDRVKEQLAKAAAKYDKAAARAILGKADDIIVIDETPSNGARPKRAPRQIPAGTFSLRYGKCTYKGRVYEACSIAHMFCLIAPVIIKSGEVDAENVAASIQSA